MVTIKEPHMSLLLRKDVTLFENIVEENNFQDQADQVADNYCHCTTPCYKIYFVIIYIAASKYNFQKFNCHQSYCKKNNILWQILETFDYFGIRLCYLSSHEISNATYRHTFELFWSNGRENLRNSVTEETPPEPYLATLNTCKIYVVRHANESYAIINNFFLPRIISTVSFVVQYYVRKEWRRL